MEDQIDVSNLQDQIDVFSRVLEVWPQVYPVGQSIGISHLIEELA